MQGATPEFEQGLREAFDEIYDVGQTSTFRCTFPSGDVALFCGVTDDYNPYHQDESFAKESPYGRLNIPGLLTGSMLMHIGSLLDFLITEMSIQYRGAVFAGNTITRTVIVTEKDEYKRRIEASAEFVNHDGTEVLRASLGGFLGKVRLAS